MRRAIIYRHLLCWLIFIIYEVTFLQVTGTLKTSLTYLLIYYIINAGLFYFNAHVVLAYAFFKTNKAYAVAFIGIVGEIALYLIVKIVTDDLLAHQHYPYFTGFHLTERYVFTNSWRAVYFIGLSVAYWSMLYFIRFREKAHEMEKRQLLDRADRLELENKFVITENAYLQNQISPHLLFNTLSYIHNSVYRLSLQAGRAVILLAELMRYSLITAEGGQFTTLEEELIQVQQLIELSKLRSEDELHIEFSQNIDAGDKKIIPLALITMVENMLKHGELTDKNKPASIVVGFNKKKLELATVNKKREVTPYARSGIGLVNLERRLRNAYGKSYELIIAETKADYSITLIIPL